MLRTLLTSIFILPLIAAAQAPATLPATVRIPGTTVSFDLVKLPPGSVTLASPDKDSPPRKIDIKPFWIGRTEVTWQEYTTWFLRLDLPEDQRFQDIFAETRPSLPYGPYDHGYGADGYAALAVHSHAAQLYCKWLSEKTGHSYRLPTEAEWEYACRAGSDAEPFNTPADLKSIAWFRDNSLNDQDDPVPHPVAARLPNAFGLYDMLGNLAEWTIASDGLPVVKGGSYKHPARDLNSRWRAPYDPRWQLTDPNAPKSQWWFRDALFVGFRVVREE